MMSPPIYHFPERQPVFIRNRNKGPDSYEMFRHLGYDLTDPMMVNVSVANRDAI